MRTQPTYFFFKFALIGFSLLYMVWNRSLLYGRIYMLPGKFYFFYNILVSYSQSLLTTKNWFLQVLKNVPLKCKYTEEDTILSFQQ